MKIALALCLVPAIAVAHPDSSIIRREIRRHIPEFRACYERALEKQPDLEGKVIATFTVQRDGSVRDAVATGMPPIDACIAKVVMTLRFPPNGKGTFVVNYPFVFAPDRR